MNARPGPAHPTRLLQSTHRSLELTWRGTDLEGKKRHRFAWICTNDLVKAFGEFGNLRRGSSTRALHGGRSRPTLLPSRSLTARVCLDGRTECPMDSGHDRRSSLREVLLDQAFDLLAQLLDARRRHVDGVTRHSCSLNPSPERLLCASCRLTLCFLEPDCLRSSPPCCRRDAGPAKSPTKMSHCLPRP